MVQAERAYKKKNKFQKVEKKKTKFEDHPRLTEERARIAKKPAMDRGAKCLECPLFLFKATGPVMGEVVKNARLVIIADRPADEELDKGRPAVGGSSRSIFEPLLQEGIEREDCTVTNASLCAYPDNDSKEFEHRLKIQWEIACARAKEESKPKPPKPLTPAQCCQPRLNRDIEESNSKFILTLGNSAIESVARSFDIPFGKARKVKPGETRIASLKTQLGHPLTTNDGTIIVSTYHPAFAMRKGSRQYKHVIQQHIERAAKIANRGYIDWQEPPYILNPTVEQIEETLKKMFDSQVPVTIDIETDQGKKGKEWGFDPQTCRIRCIGFGATIDGEEVLICVPIRKITGEEWWSREDKLRVVKACADVLNSNPLVGHNLAFDTGVLLRVGLMHDRTQEYSDGMLAHHDTLDNDLPHDLGFVSGRYFEVPYWKGVAGDDKYYTNVTDEDLHLYNLRDVTTSQRLQPELEQDLYRYGTTAQYELDRKMAPVFRDMGELGLFVDEVRRGELSRQMNTEAYAKLEILKGIVGPKFNPNSGPQVRQFLFGKKGYIPIMSTKKGQEWKEGEDPATSADALMKLLMQQGGDDEGKKFINTLLEYRGCTKLKSTYIDDLKVHYPDWSKWNLDVPTVEPVTAQVYHKYKQEERRDIIKERWPEEWGALREMKGAVRRDRLRELISRVDEGVWRPEEIIKERPAISRLHTTYKIHTIPTGRCATSPAIQNWPEQGKANMRDMIIAPPGHVIVGADADQIELRLYAVIAQDRLLLEAFEKKMDPHAYNAASMFVSRFSKMFGRKLSVMEAYEYIMSLKHDEPANDKEAKQHKQFKDFRKYAKTFVYLMAYGGSPDKLYESMATAREKGKQTLTFPGLKKDDVDEWHENWGRTHPETQAWQQECERVARISGWTGSPIGSMRKRFYPGGLNKPGASYNTVIQGSAAEIANAALLRIAERIPYQCWSPFTGLAFQVHDYLGLYCPEDRALEAKKIVEEAMNTVVFGMPITATAKISKRWSQQ